VLVTTRATGPTLLDERTRGTHLELGPLEPASSAALTDVVGRTIGVLSAADVQRLTDRAAGNPLFRARARRGRRRRRAARIRSSGSSRRGSTSSPRATACCCAMRPSPAGSSTSACSVELVRADDDEPNTRRASTPAIRRAGFLMCELIEQSGPGEMRFRHALYRDVAYEGLPFRRRLRAALCDRRDPRARPCTRFTLSSPSCLSLHFHLGHRYDRSWRYSVIAGDSSLQLPLSFRLAIEFYQRALEAARMFRRNTNRGRSGGERVAPSTLSRACGALRRRAQGVRRRATAEHRGAVVLALTVAATRRGYRGAVRSLPERAPVVQASREGADRDVASGDPAAARRAGRRTAVTAPGCESAKGS